MEEGVKEPLYHADIITPVSFDHNKQSFSQKPW